MPGKVNPVIPEVVTQVAAQVIGNDAAITVGGMQGHFELNVFVPLMARNLLDSIRLLATASRLLAEKCVDGIEANRETLRALRRADAVGGDRAQPLHRLRPRGGDRQGGGRDRPLAARGRPRGGVDEETLDQALDYRAMARPHARPRRAHPRSTTATARRGWPHAPLRARARPRARVHAHQRPWKDTDEGPRRSLRVPLRGSSTLRPL